MNAPGDSALIFVLLAVFVACTGYAAGRLHQRWQAAQDREEAYRDGYEKGTSNVFSTAVRMLGPKRAARGAAPVTSKTPAPEPKKPEKSDTPLSFPAPQPPPPYAVTEPAAIGGVIYRQLRDPRPADGSAPVMGEQPTKPPLPHPRTAEALAPRPALDGSGRPATPEVIKIREERATVDERETAEQRSAAGQKSAAEQKMATAGRPGLTEMRDENDEGAVRPDVTDVREESDGAADTPQSDETVAASRRRRGGHRAKAPEEDTTINQRGEPGTPTGRHTVPDELVRAATYRLPPDRIFRARVRDSTPLPEEPTTRLPSVPKPRDES